MSGYGGEDSERPAVLRRRPLIQNALAALVLAPGWAQAARSKHRQGVSPLAATVYDKALQATLPKGARLRIVARSGVQSVNHSDYPWHGAPDGGACFKTQDGGWVYVSNSELPNTPDDPLGGAGALRFNRHGALIDSYSVLHGTHRNCAGGRTLWNTWLSCEENGEQGQVYECDPLGERPAKKLPALGAFNHEAVAMDPQSGRAYLTEDQPDGCVYRFTPDHSGDLRTGLLEVAVAEGLRLTWQRVPDPTATDLPLRHQVAGSARFKGGEGIVYAEGHICFTTKYDNRVWRVHLDTNRLSLAYDASLYTDPVLTGVDNIALCPGGELLIAEDGGDMQLVVLTEEYVPVPLVTLHGQDGSELTGPAFSPDGRWLYFSSQRGFEGESAKGLTYELRLPEGWAVG